MDITAVNKANEQYRYHNAWVHKFCCWQRSSSLQILHCI